MSKKIGTEFGVLTVVALALAIISNVGNAEQAVTTEAAPAAPVSKVVGTMDLRPSMRLADDSFHTENAFELGYQFAPGRILTAVQYFETNLSNPSPNISGANVTVYDTYLRARFNKLWEDKDLGLSFSYQNRTYLPVSQASRDKGMIATFRNYLTLSKTISDSVTFTFSELPIFGVYDRPGVVNAKGELTANMAFENRLYFITDISLVKDLRLSLPLFLYQTRARSMAGAVNDAAWTFTAVVWPELTYTVADNMSLGLSYYSSNLIAKDFSQTTISDGLSKGTVQVVLGATL